MKKIAILGLHLGYGGVEQALVNQANSLCEDYEVELAITYKLNDTIPYFLNPKVKVKYLTDCKPNREEFKKYLGQHRYIKVLKEGLKSLKILYLKVKTMKDYIKKSDASVIISSRVEINGLLGRYASKNVIKIAEEHRHHNNDKKYIERLRLSCTNIDYLVLVSKELTEFYQKKVPIKCVYIPNSLDYFPKEAARLDTNNIVCIGRLAREKGFLDLIDVFKLIVDKNSHYHLDIVGDGEEYEKIRNKIKDLGIDKNVTMHGFLNKDEIHKLLYKESLYLMCSYEESFGIVLIEAGSFGIPAISFASAQGAREIIKNNLSGYLILDRDKKEMAKKALELLEKRDRLKDMGNKAREVALEFSFSKVKKIWLEFMEEVLKND